MSFAFISHSVHLSWAFVCNCEEIRDHADNVGLYCGAEGGDLKSPPGNGEMETFFFYNYGLRTVQITLPLSKGREKITGPMAADWDPTQRNSLIKKRVRCGTLVF